MGNRDMPWEIGTCHGKLGTCHGMSLYYDFCRIEQLYRFILKQDPQGIDPRKCSDRDVKAADG